MSFSWNSIPYDVLVCICAVVATPSELIPEEDALATDSETCPAGTPSPKGLLALSMVDSRTREACYPWVFGEICFTNGSKWEAFDEGMKVMLKNPALCRAVRSFKITTWFSKPDAQPPTPTTYALVPVFLTSLPRLNTLTFRIQDPFVPSFRSSFSSHGPLLPLLTLKISTNSFFLIPHCPNIREFEEEELYRDKRVEALSWVEPLGRCCVGLRALLTNAPIASGMLRTLLKHIPHIEVLNVACGIITWRSEPEDEGNTEGIMKFLPVFASFPSLRTLKLPNADDLDIGFCYPICGNGLARNPWLVEQLEREEMEAEEMVAKGVERVCVGVRKLWIGGGRFERDESGVMRRSI